jgi:uncharacterized membrane protein YgcG
MQRRSFVVSGPIDSNVKKEWTIRILAIATLFLPAFISKGLLLVNNPSREILAAYLTRNYRWILSVFVTNMSLTDTFDHTLVRKLRTWTLSLLFAAGTLIIVYTKFMPPSILTLVLFYVFGILTQFGAGVYNLLLVAYEWRKLWRKAAPFSIKEYSFLVYSIPYFWSSIYFITLVSTESANNFDASLTNMLVREINCLVTTAIISLLPTRYSRHKSNALQVPLLTLCRVSFFVVHVYFISLCSCVLVPFSSPTPPSPYPPPLPSLLSPFYPTPSLHPQDMMYNTKVSVSLLLNMGPLKLLTNELDRLMNDRLPENVDLESAQRLLDIAVACNTAIDRLEQAVSATATVSDWRRHQGDTDGAVFTDEGDGEGNDFNALHATYAATLTRVRELRESSVELLMMENGSWRGDQEGVSELGPSLTRHENDGSESHESEGHGHEGHEGHGGSGNGGHGSQGEGISGGGGMGDIKINENEENKLYVGGSNEGTTDLHPSPGGDKNRYKNGDRRDRFGDTDDSREVQCSTSVNCRSTSRSQSRSQSQSMGSDMEDGHVSFDGHTRTEDECIGRA